MKRIITLRENLGAEQLFEDNLNKVLEAVDSKIHSIHVSDTKYGTRVVTIVLSEAIELWDELKALI